LPYLQVPSRQRKPNGEDKRVWEEHVEHGWQHNVLTTDKKIWAKYLENKLIKYPNL
jgi:hypothetical protein